MLPSTIYGIPSNALTKAGVQHTSSIQLPMLTKASIGRGQGGIVGKGAALWNHVSNDDSKHAPLRLPKTAVADRAPQRPSFSWSSSTR